MDVRGCVCVGVFVHVRRSVSISTIKIPALIAIFFWLFRHNITRFNRAKWSQRSDSNSSQLRRESHLNIYWPWSQRASFCMDAQRVYSDFYDWLPVFFPSCLPGILACSFGLLKFKRVFGLPAFSPCYFHGVTSPGHTLYCASYKKSEQWLLDSHSLRLSADASTSIWKNNNLCQILLW